MLSEASKGLLEIKKEVVKFSQIVRAERMLNRTLSGIDLASAPEKLKSNLSKLKEEFEKAKDEKDVKKAKEVLKEMKKNDFKGKGQREG